MQVASRANVMAPEPARFERVNFIGFVALYSVFTELNGNHATLSTLSKEVRLFMAESTCPQAGLAWYALRIRSNQEKLVFSMLETKGCEAFLPLYRSERRWSDRVKQLDLPLFPGYLFCRLDLGNALMPVLTTPGVVSIVGAGKMPVPVSDDEIEAVHTVIRSGLAVTPWPGLTVGSKVLIERGPLVGLEGIAVNVEGQCRLVVSVHLLQRAISVEIDRRWARPIAKQVQTEAAALSNARRSSASPIPFMSRNRSAAVSV